jgi:2-amino-4-hydroxy-6-hydroxymethyldihydropteridine diphosphokinase
MTARALIGLGANLGNARESIEQALVALKQTAGIETLRSAPLYASEPIEATGPTFINTVAEIHTTLEPLALLDVMQAIENDQGRERPYRHAPRTLDLDLLWYDGVTLDTPRLTLPHPRMHQRAFVLKPLHDLIPSLAHPQGSIETLLTRCADQKLWLLK